MTFRVGIFNLKRLLNLELEDKIPSMLGCSARIGVLIPCYEQYIPRFNEYIPCTGINTIHRTVSIKQNKSTTTFN